MTAPWWTRLKSVTLHSDDEPEPQLWPDWASEEYIEKRLAIREAEAGLRDRIEELARWRRALPHGTEISNYALTEGPASLEEADDPRTVQLRDLFGDQETLVIYHLMFHPEDDEACAMCSLWVDGFAGVIQHLTQRTAFAVIAKAPIDKLTDWGRRRGWHRVRLVSSYGSSFSRDLRFETRTGGQWPMVAVFSRQGDVIRHRYSQCADLLDGERGIDLLSPVWNVFDLLPQGRGNWLPDLNEHCGGVDVATRTE